MACGEAPLATLFSRSLRSLETDGSGRSVLALALGVLLVAVWLGWFTLTRITLIEVTPLARLEVDREVRPVQAPVSGRVIGSALVLGREVKQGDLLVELDASALLLELEEQRARLAGLAQQLQALHAEIAAEERATGKGRAGARVAVDEARAQLREVEAASKLARDELARLQALRAQGHIPEAEHARAVADAEQRAAAADRLRLTVERLGRDEQTKETGDLVRLERLRREVALLEGEITTGNATVERIRHEVDKRSIRAPAAGRLGEVASLQAGAVVAEGDRLATVVPSGELRVVADFSPSAALARIRPGQHARLRLDGFPWTEYGSVPATVAAVASEARDGKVRVELSVDPRRPLSIPLQHGLPGTVEVEVDRVSPATLVLRTAGKLLGGHPNAPAVEAAP